MRTLRIFFLLACTCASITAQDYSPGAKRPPADEKPSCQEFPFGQGCLAASVGPAFGSINTTLVYGFFGGASYFVVDRLALGLGGSALFSSSVNNYAFGPMATYYIGPFSGYLFNVSVGASRQIFRGSVSGEGWSYGPSVGLMTNLAGRVYWGISVGYSTFVLDEYRKSDWSWSPIVFIPF